MRDTCDQPERIGLGEQAEWHLPAGRLPSRLSLGLTQLPATSVLSARVVRLRLYGSAPPEVRAMLTRGAVSRPQLRGIGAAIALVALLVTSCSPDPTPAGSDNPVASATIVATLSPAPPLRPSASTQPTAAPALEVPPQTVGAGSGSTCLIRDDGSIACWGTGMSAPPDGTFKSVASDHGSGCGIRTDGSLTCWGFDPEYSEPPPQGSFAAVAISGDGGCALGADGRISCWGDTGSPPGSRFQRIATASDGDAATVTCALGVDGTVACWSDLPEFVAPPPPGRFTAITVGSSFACGVRDDARLQCWGSVDPEEDHGQLRAPAGTFRDVVAGGAHVCAIRTDGTLVCWGDDTLGQARPPSGVFTGLSSGDDHSCATRSDGEVACWGSDVDGAASLADRAMRVAASGVMPRAKAVSIAEDGPCIIRPNGTIQCWGAGSQPPKGRFTALATDGYSDNCAIRTDGTIDCWGRYGYLPRPPAGRYTTVSLGGDGEACAIRVGGQLTCWGAYERPRPPKGRFLDVIISSEEVCGLRTDGRIVCRAAEYSEASTPPKGTFVAMPHGWPICGIRGDGTVACSGVEEEEMAVLRLLEGKYAQIDISQRCGLTLDGELRCVANDSEDYPAPVTPTGAFVTFSAFNEGGCAIRTTGELACWGAEQDVVARRGPSSPSTWTSAPVRAPRCPCDGRARPEGRASCPTTCATAVNSIPVTGRYGRLASPVSPPTCGCGLPSQASCTRSRFGRWPVTARSPTGRVPT